MADKFEHNQPSLSSPAEDHFEITPSDTEPLADATRALYENTAGAVRVRLVNGDTQITYNVTAGQILPLRVAQVYATGTDATVVGWY